MAAWRSTTDLKTPRRMRLRVMTEKNPSTALSQEAEVEHPSGMTSQPGADLGMFVGPVVVEEGVDDLSGRDGGFDGVEEADELLVAVLLHAASEHHAVEHVEGGEQGGRSVALVVMRHRRALARLDRQ